MSSLHFRSIEALEVWLRAAHVPLHEWGRGEAKSLADLWAEYQSRETSLQSAPPLRLVEFVQLLIVRDSLTLIELEQEYVGGRRRQRRQPPSEKIKNGETPILAARRCLREELGIDAGDVSLTYEQGPRQVIRRSSSYPGLLTRYVKHTVRAIVDGLPEEDFWTANVAANDPVKRHHWGWRPADDTAE